MPHILRLALDRELIPGSNNEHMLIERPVDFAHGYRMRCETCQTSNWLAAEDCAVWSDEAMMTCSKCENDFNFGSAVIDLRDSGDPALDDSILPQLAWYHTTKEPGWPAVSKPLPDDEVMHLSQRSGWTEEQVEKRRLVHENQALHLGTYEAALEAMLRRMREQDDQHSTFYLHRVRLGQNVVIEHGWRDENREPAAKITAADLADHEVDVIRYLNAHESMGSLSLAVVRGAIESTQRLTLPVQELYEQPPSTVVEHLRQLRDEVHAVLARHEDKPLPALGGFLRPAAVGQRKRVSPPEAWKAVTKMEEFVADQYLAEVSPVVRENFLRSLDKQAPEANHEKDLLWLRKFIGLAKLFTSPCEVQKALDGQPWRAIEPVSRL